ncbi:MAG: hypothetical protein HYT35_00720 [Candidatus Staskawiczbacteria bacterium]|nr:hypothetical protein [Candidatus Staskawiczbacteria bacterium]
MILTPHLLFGAAVGSKIEYMPLTIILAFLSHYLLDLIPHIEYSVANISKKQWQRAWPDISRVFLDFSLGMILILAFAPAGKQIIILSSALTALIPDGLTIVSLISPNKLLDKHDQFHRKKVHFLKHKRIPVFLRILSQILAVVISVFLLKY